MSRRLLFLGLLFVPLAIAAGAPWEKPPEQWTMADVFHILQNSPWSPAKFSLDSSYRQRNTNPQSGVVDDSAVGGRNSAVVPGVTFTPSHALPPVTVLWWSSKTIREAEAKRLAARAEAKAAPVNGEFVEMPDYVLSVEGDEPMRILRDAKEDLHDTVFLELENGGTLDLTGVQYLENSETDAVRTQLHFLRILNGEPAIDPESERVIFHCRANAKKPMPGRDNALSFRVEFNPRQMKAQGHPDL
jgi:hypothetical protein